MARRHIAKRRNENEIEFGRIVAFSDGVFAIAITLLVLNLGIEKGLTEGQIDNALWDQREVFLAYAISFAVIGRFWLVHHRFFAEVEAFDGRLLGLNLVYLGFIVLIPFSSELLGEYGGKTTAVVFYSLNLAVVVLLGLLMSADARRRGLTSIDDRTHRENRVRSAYIAGIFLLSIPLAYLAPEVAPYLWLVLFIDPSRRLAGNGSAADDEGDRPARL
ncbi:MAG TPA: TMEM175 family protein [Solirubrobacterales bacterium]|nr:TMEM175 family protein [Solirubrobacterales bacterium]